MPHEIYWKLQQSMVGGVSQLYSDAYPYYAGELLNLLKTSARTVGLAPWIT